MYWIIIFLLVYGIILYIRSYLNLVVKDEE